MSEKTGRISGDARLPASVRPLLAHYVSRLQEELPGLFAGLYLHGSIAYGSFFEGLSDIDVLALLSRECSVEDLAHLRAIHSDIRARWPELRLEASYVQWSERGSHGTSAPPHPFHHDGIFHDRGIFDFNSPRWACVLWWQVRSRGIALFGPPPAALGLGITAEDLRAESRRLVETFWIDWTRRRAQVSGLRHDFVVDWVVLGVLRTWFTLREGDVISKPGAADYGLAHLPRRWHRLISGTMKLRHRRARPGLIRRLFRGADALLFMRFMVGECRRT